MFDESRKSRRILDRPDALPAFSKPAPEAVAAEGGDDDGDKVENAIAEGRSEGYRVGRELASAEFKEELEGVRAELVKSLQRLANLSAEQTKRLEGQLLEITLEAVSRITRTRIEEGDPVAARALEEALMTLPDSEAVRARVHPDDAESIRESLHQEIDCGRVELVPDESLSRGSVIAECDAGRVDATLEAAEESVRAALLDGETAP